jgi:kynureninase
MTNLSPLQNAGAERAHFELPVDEHGQPQHYFCGNSLGLMPRAARAEVMQVLNAWGQFGVEGHFKGDAPWMPYHERATRGLAHVLGAKPIEVVAMNTLTVNLHLLMASFFRPKGTRCKILIESRAFPSDRHAVESQLRWHGLDPEHCLVELSAAPGSTLDDPASLRSLDPQHIIEQVHALGDSLALVLFPGVQYATGQAFDISAIAAAAHAVGAKAGFDLAHAVGNLNLNLHASQADFAVWCSYKYLNSGPGAVAGAFVHEKHAHSNLPRLAGWWGHQAETRFKMGPEFIATPGVEGWQLSNPPILSMAPLIASLTLFEKVSMPELRRRSVALTAYLTDAIAADLSKHLEIITPADPAQRGCQLSLRLRAGRAAGRACFDALHASGIVTDWREPDIIRVAPAPLYNTLADVDGLIAALSTHFQV